MAFWGLQGSGHRAWWPELWPGVSSTDPGFSHLRLLSLGSGGWPGPHSDLTQQPSSGRSPSSCPSQGTYSGLTALISPPRHISGNNALELLVKLSSQAFPGCFGLQ